MNPLRKGPGLKMPDLKVPDFILDVYYDLRERHLLPLVAILLVAIVALPIVLSQGSSDEEPAAGAGTGTAGDLAGTPSSKLVVAKETPGLRDYKRRLAGDTPKDPFEQQYTTPEGESSGTTGGEAEFTSPSGESGSGTTGGGSAPETSHSGEGSGEPSDEEHLRYYAFAIDVRITPVSDGAGAGQSKSKTQATVRHNLPVLTALPSRDEPALTFIAVTKDRKKAVMLVADNVTALFGDSICLVGAESCQLLAIEPGMPETIVYGDRTFHIELLKLRLLKTDKLNVAPLGKSGESGG